jgi:Effector Associated Constant Component 1
MDAFIRVEGVSSDDLAALGEWLNDESELRGHCHMIHSSINDTDLGSIPELLNVALGAGGAGTILASSLITWLKTRRTTAKITVESAGRSVTLDIETVNEVAPLLEQILHIGDND